MGYKTIPGVAEIVVLHSAAIAAEVLQRVTGGNWPSQPEVIGADGDLRLDSIGFAAPREACRTTALA